ncbi:MAG: Holliday junction branch migration DNA helicase RuvB [Bdellovibrionota bacterium]|nr:Holliday junction branch migration DNA helicase RuvB [Pseudobdellovibrionaceae bacterium]|tara:strand:+ start:54077 stop:55105 length:1029 start_codon:yes stop_codon:yes gene_type:complete
MARIVSGENLSTREDKIEKSLRPTRFEDFPGQHKVKEKIQIYVQAAKKRAEAMDHTLLCGPPGLGKTTLSYILAQELDVPIKTTSGPALDKKGDLAAILTSLQPNSILFIDEIHRLNKVVEEYLYSAMEDYTIDIVTGEGLGARTMKFSLAPFTLVGATTRAGLMDKPFLDRFGIVERLSFYDQKDLAKIVERSAYLLEVKMQEEAALEIAGRCRGTPRIANRLLRRVRDFAEVKSEGVVTREVAKFALEQLEVDSVGLDDMDRQILSVICEKFAGGPVGIDTLAASLSEERGTIEEVYEPYLLQQGLIQKTPRGRVATNSAFEHLGLLTEAKKSESKDLVL